MKFSVLGFAAFASIAIVQCATNQTQLENALSLIQQMPDCAKTCLLATVAASGISATNLDLSASCNNKTATASTEACVLQTCTIRQQLAAKNLTEVLCERPTHDAPNVSIAGLTSGSIAMLSYLLRMASKVTFPCDQVARVQSENLWWDDLTISIAAVLIIPMMIFANIMASLGMGRDVWTVFPDNITKILRIFYFDELLYMVSLPIIKIAVCCTYLRIFSQKNFRRAVFVALGLNAAYAFAFLIITIFQCTPINTAWVGWDKEHGGTCRDINAQSWASAAANIILDIFVVVLPMPVLWDLNLNPRKRLLVMLMFGVGFFVTIVSIIRLHLLVKFGDTKNLTYDYKQVGYWTEIEANTALCCACMPGIRNLLRRVFPRAMGQSTAGKSGRSTPGSSNILSGPTAVNSITDKSDVDVFTRPIHSDDGEFVPLTNVSSPVGSAYNATRPLSPTIPCKSIARDHTNSAHRPTKSVRNFSRPVSPTEGLNRRTLP